MDNLQKLLDERWPIGTEGTIQGRIMNEHNRKIFSEGYSAALIFPPPESDKFKDDLHIDTIPTDELNASLATLDKLQKEFPIQ